jgi:hypothetical protein
MLSLKLKENHKIETKQTRGGGCYTMVLPFTLQSILRQKEEELWKLKYFTLQKYYNLPKILQTSSKRNQNPSRYYYYNSIITNLKFQHKPKYIIFQKSSYQNRPIIIIIIIIIT